MVGEFANSSIREQANAQKDDVFMAPGGGPIEGLGAKGLPVAGYKPVQPQWALDLVNENKVLEERVLRQIDRHVRNHGSTEIDQRAVALARTKVQEAFMWLNRGVFQPQRILGDL